MSSKISLSDRLTPQLVQDYNELRQLLLSNQYLFPELPKNLEGDSNEGEVFTRAYPIQGLLKYHGLANPDIRIAYNSSISMNNSCAETITYLKMDPALKSDQIILNGGILEPQSNEAIRIQHMVKIIRSIAKINTPVQIISRNIMTETGLPTMGKGLGTSASGGAAIAHAMMEVVYRNNTSIKENTRLRSIFARYLAGSAARSAVGGIGLWLNHPNMETWDSYAIRLDRAEDQRFLKNIALITIAIPLKLKTDQAHLAAPTSPFFEAWLYNRKTQLHQFLEALNNHNISRIGELAEYDTQCLHAVTNTAMAHSIGHLITADSLNIMILAHKLRKNNIPVYYSLDTGPSVVLLTQNQFISEIRDALIGILPSKLHESISFGKIGGPSSIIQNRTDIPTILREDLEKYGQ